MFVSEAPQEGLNSDSNAHMGRLEASGTSVANWLQAQPSATQPLWLPASL